MAGGQNEVQAFDLCALGLDDDILALAELERDPVFHKLDSGRYGYYLEQSLGAGRRAARPLQGQDIRVLLEEAGIEFRLAESAGTGTMKVALRAQLDWSGKVPHITVYRESLRQLQIAAETRGALGPVTFDRIVDIHLAHEYYHWLEYRSGQFTNELLEPIECFRIGPFRRKATVLQTSEIAAHAFCKEMLGLPYLPSLLDHMYLIQTGETKMEQFAENVKKWKVILASMDSVCYNR